MATSNDELLRSLTPKQESQLTDKQKTVRQFLRRRARISHVIGTGAILVALVALAYKSFALH
jgi:hypothetical protein